MEYWSNGVISVTGYWLLATGCLLLADSCRDCRKSSTPRVCKLSNNNASKTPGDSPEASGSTTGVFRQSRQRSAFSDF